MDMYFVAKSFFCSRCSINHAPSKKCGRSKVRGIGNVTSVRLIDTYPPAASSFAPYSFSDVLTWAYWALWFNIHIYAEQGFKRTRAAHRQQHSFPADSTDAVAWAHAHTNPHTPLASFLTLIAMRHYAQLYAMADIGPWGRRLTAFAKGVPGSYRGHANDGMRSNHRGCRLRRPS